MTFSITTDLALVRSILTNDKCYRRMANDAAPDIDEFRIGQRQDIRYVLAKQGKPEALFLLCDWQADPETAEVHFCFLPCAWGHAWAIADAFLQWVWRATPLNRLIGFVPSYNRLALRLARSVGFTGNGKIYNAGSKHGKPYDLLMLETLRPI